MCKFWLKATLQFTLQNVIYLYEPKKRLASPAFTIDNLLVDILGCFKVGNYSLHKKMKFDVKDFFIKFDQIRRKLPIWPHLLKKS